MHTFVIAEAAATHDGRCEAALRLVDLAAEIGADACKFQYVSRAERLAERRHAPEYLAAYRLLTFPVAWLELLKARCDQRGIELLVTTFLPEDVAVVAPYVRRFKVASFEAMDREFIVDHFQYWKPLVISLGMADRRETMVLDAWLSGYSHHVPQPPDGLKVTLLHCVSSYPAPTDQMNLRWITAFRWDVLGAHGDNRGMARVGLSDHTRHPWTGGLAVAAGAEIIEFHVRLDDTDPENADYAVARTPKEAVEYIQNIRLAEAMMGDGVKRTMPSEEAMLKYRVGA